MTSTVPVMVSIRFMGFGYLLTLVPTINATTPQQLPLRGNPSLIQKVVTGAVNRQANNEVIKISAQGKGSN